MRPLSTDDYRASVHPNVLEAIRVWKETGRLDWEAPDGTPDPPEVRCAVCLDVGEVAVRQVGATTTYVPCTACTLRIERRLASVPIDFRRSFSDYLDVAPTEEMRELGIWMQEWARSGKGSVLLVGTEGAYKTTLASTAYLYRVEHFMAERPMWTKAPWLIEEIRRSYDRDLSVPLASLPLERARTADLLALDDMGACQVNARNAPWVQEQFYNVIDYRSDQHLPTIFTSNLSIDQLRQQLGRAIVSRMVGMCRGQILPMEPGADVRYRATDDC